MNSVPEKESLLKQTAAAPPFLVRFSVLVVSAKEFISWRWWRMKSNIVKLVTVKTVGVCLSENYVSVQTYPEQGHRQARSALVRETS